ncbi:MAG: hypothetical protein AAB872_00645 [Patescibacteria group bacterium]
MIRNYLSPVSLFEILTEYLICFVFINLIFKNLYVSLILLFLIILTKYVYKNINILKNLITSGDFNYLILKPINPIYRILIYGTNPIDLIINFILFIIIAINFINYSLIILSSLIILFSFHIFILSLTLLFSPKFSVEKIFPQLILICLVFIFSFRSLVGLTNPLGQLSLSIFAISSLFLSIKLWNQTVKNYL